MSQVFRRDASSGSKIAIVVVIVVVVLAIAIISYIIVRGRRASRLQKGRDGYRNRTSWRDSIASTLAGFQTPPPVRPDVRESVNLEIGRGAGASPHDVEAAGGVDRQTSVRSVMTLPAYTSVPRDDEGVLGREGERAGMDTVVEFPESTEEEEARREEEMESLYQIRTQRRTEIAEREERRRQRREARQRGDHVTLRRLRHESMLRAGEMEDLASATMMSEHESRSRERRVSAVDYGALGLARHDGSRVRANSNDSDRPLLDAAGGLGMAGPARPWVSRESLGSHHRGRSSLSNLSMTSYGSDDHSGFDDSGSDMEEISLHQPRSRASSRPSSRPVSRPHSRPATGTRSRATSFGQPLGIITTNLSQVQTIPPDPPQYEAAVEFEEAPPYTSPMATRVPALQLPTQGQPATDDQTGAPSLPTIERLPSIRITGETPTEAFPDFSRHGHDG